MITNDEKIKIIFNDISLHYYEFLHQAYCRLLKHKHLLNPYDKKRELISDIVYSIIIKLEKEKDINFFYKMVLENKLQNYIFKSIYIEAQYLPYGKSGGSPFLRKILKENNRWQFNDAINIYKNTNIKNEEREEIIEKIWGMLEPPIAIELFGIDTSTNAGWEYYTKIFKDYIIENLNYREISEKYNLFPYVIYDSITHVKKKIKERCELEKIKLR